MLAEAASFSTCMVSMSFMFSVFRLVVVGTPSMMKRGSCDELNEPPPRILTVPAPTGDPLLVMVIPGTLPCRARIGSVSLLVFSSSVFTTATEPVKWPYAGSDNQ